jgi:glycosyltransferase involved in cell wall biosynthesis
VARVTILMPVRDAGRWLGECLDSIVGQSESDWDLVAIDDGSRDDSRALLDARAGCDARIRVASTSPGRRGLVAALNAGLALARSPLLARMDADDVADPRRLERQCAALDADTSLFAAACKVDPFPDSQLGDGMRRYVDWQNGLLAPDQIARDRFVESPVLHPSTIMRTAALRDSLGGWRETGWPEDWDLFLRALAAGLRIGRVNEVLLAWRLHGRQATRVDPRYGEDRLMACRAHHLANELRQRSVGCAGRPLWILGAGPVGKSLCKLLAIEGVVPAGLVDVDPRKIGGRVRDGVRAWPVVSMDALFTASPRPYAISAVGRPGGRTDVRGLLSERGWRELEDYLVAA